MCQFDINISKFKTKIYNTRRAIAKSNTIGGGNRRKPVRPARFLIQPDELNTQQTPQTTKQFLLTAQLTFTENVKY